MIYLTCNSFIRYYAIYFDRIGPKIYNNRVTSDIEDIDKQNAQKPAAKVFGEPVQPSSQKQNNPIPPPSTVILKTLNIYSSLHPWGGKKNGVCFHVNWWIFTQTSSSGADDIRSQLLQRHAMPGFPLIDWITVEKDATT